MAKKEILTLREVVLFGVLGALTFALQVVMGPLPNIEPVSLLVLLFGAVFGYGIFNGLSRVYKRSSYIFSFC